MLASVNESKSSFHSPIGLSTNMLSFANSYDGAVGRVQQFKKRWLFAVDSPSETAKPKVVQNVYLLN